MSAALIQGFLMQASLIVAIGPQNTLVLSHGLRRRHQLATTLVCIVCDLLLIALGVAGAGALIAGSEPARLALLWSGVAFLVAYGSGAFVRAWRGNGGLSTTTRAGSAQQAVIGALAVSLLNPHVYLDAFMLIGGTSTRFAGDERYLFGAGAILFSALWFAGLAYAAGLASAHLQSNRAWRWIDCSVGVVMWATALALGWNA